ncbi:MAG TPA: FkbM family methyltransferase, partial [Longimicrobiales bacterium]|nr:FkbM family methyltransferase [Longimicrobiales bacterium]
MSATIGMLADTHVGPGAIARLLGALLRRRVRGSSRLTLALARRLPGLQAVPVPVAGGVVYMDLRRDASHAWLALAPRPYEPGIQELLRRLLRPGDVAFEIGANLGWHSVWMSSLVGPRGQVHAFEPLPSLHPLLRRTCAALPNGALHPFGLSSAAGEAELVVPLDDCMASLGHWTDDAQAGPVRRVRCRFRALDDEVHAGRLPRPDLCTVDVEGAEPLVFAGATDTLDRADAPILVFECNRPASAALGLHPADGARRLLALPAARYRLFAFDDDRGEIAPVAPDDIRSWTALAIPEAR